MADALAPAGRCGIDTVAIARIERLLDETPAEALRKFFSALELEESGEGPGRAASLAARFAAKEACVKLFPREAALGQIEPEDFSIARDNYGAPRVVCGPRATELLGRHRIASIAVSLTHDRVNASAVAQAERANVDVPPAGRFFFRFLPLRRAVILANLRRVYGETLPKAEIEALAQAHYGHLWRLAGEFLRYRWLSAAQKAALVRVENVEAFAAALEQRKGVLVLTGHFGNWELLAHAIGLCGNPIHLVHRPFRNPLFDDFVNAERRRSGTVLISKRRAAHEIIQVLRQRGIVAVPFDQNATGRWGVFAEFFGVPASTHPGLARLHELSGAPVYPVFLVRKDRSPRHEIVILPRVETVRGGGRERDTVENTRRFNRVFEAMVREHPDHWIWMHKRWRTRPLGEPSIY